MLFFLTLYLNTAIYILGYLWTSHKDVPTLICGKNEFSVTLIHCEAYKQAFMELAKIFSRFLSLYK